MNIITGNTYLVIFLCILYSLSSEHLASPEMKLSSALKCVILSKCSVLNMTLMIVSLLFDLISVWFLVLFKFRM